MEWNGQTRTCGLIGNPVEHTLSPLIQNHLAQSLGQNLVYVPFHVPEGGLRAAVEGAYALNLLGLNVTVPYKSRVMEYLDQVDPAARRIGAVNTLVRTGDGFKGYNTDMPGLYRAMGEDGVKVTGRKVLLLGAGGAARAVAVMLWEKGAERIYILNRTPQRARELAEHINGLGPQPGREPSSRPLAEAMALEDYPALAGEKYLAIQTTSVGMYPRTGEALIEDSAFYELVQEGYDLIFNPAKTRFMELVEAAGGRAFGGSRMLVYQGIISFELWTGEQVPPRLAREICALMPFSK